MDVTCERCGTEYEFDETLVSDRGTTVKCTQCGHLFKVFRPGADDGPRAWSVRTKDGNVQHLSSLRDLQRLITQGKLTRSDEISRSGESWKLLGDIAELVTFFKAAEASANPGDAAPRKDRTLPFRSQAPGTPQKNSPSAPPRPSAKAAEAIRPVPVAPSRGSGSGPLPAPPSAPPPRRQQPPSPTVPDRPSKVGTVLGIGEEPTLPAQANPPPSEAGPKPPRKQTLFGMGAGAGAVKSSADADAAGVTVPDSGAAARAKDSASFDAQATEIDERPAGARTGDRSVGRLEGLGGPDQPVMSASKTDPVVPETRSMPKMAAPDPEPKARTKSKTRDGYSDPAKTGHERSRGKKATAPTKRGMYVDEDAEIAARRVKRPVRETKRTGLWVSLVILLAAGAGVALGWGKIAPMLGLVETADPAAEFVARGEEALALDHRDAYEDAIREFTGAHALSERNVAVLAGLCRAHGALAQELAFRASDLAARSAEIEGDTTLAAEAATRRQGQESHASEARRFGEDAVRIDPNDISAIIALADALRLTGDLGSAQSHLDRARTLESEEPEETAELRYVSALFSLSTPEANPAPALEGSASAAAADPALLRARLLHARALLATGNVAGARGEVEAVLAAVPGHPRAQRLADAMDQGIPPAAPVVAALDGGTPDTATATVVDTGAPAPADPTTPPPAAADPRGGSSSDEPPRGRDYGWYVQRGDEFINRGDVDRAEGMFEAALAQRPGGSEAETGLGYVLHERGNNNAAIGRFQAASRRGYAAAYMGLGDAYRALGQNANALAAYRNYLNRLPGGPEASAALHQVEVLSASEAPTPDPTPTPEPTPEAAPTPDPTPTPSPTPEPTPAPEPSPAPEPAPAPATAPDELPAPAGATAADIPPQEAPAVGTE